MASSKATAAGAPTYDRIGIDTATAGPSQPQQQQLRVVAALRLGWELEELVARSYLLGEPAVLPPSRRIPGTPDADPPLQSTQPQPVADEAPRSLFLPDLFHAQSEQARLQSVVTIVRAQPALMFPGTYPPADPAARPNNGRSATPIAAQLAALATAVDALQQAIGHTDASTFTTPESKIELRRKVAESAHAIDQAIVNVLLDPTYSGETGITADPLASLLLSGYELGKSLSGTRWLLWAAHMLNARHDPEPPPKSQNIQPEWSRMFDSSRIATIQRHLSNLTPIYGGRVTMAVTKSLDYWRAALLDPTILSLESAKPLTETSPRPRSEWAHGVWTRQEAEVNLPLSDDNLNQEIILFAALCQQVDAWYDLLTLRRPAEDFPITGVISNLLRQLAEQELHVATAFLTPFLRGASLIFVILVVVVVLVLALAMTLLPTAASQQVTAGGILALGSGVLGSVAALLTRRSTPSGSSAALPAELEQRLTKFENQLQQTMIGLQNQARAAGEAAYGSTHAAQQAIEAAVASRVPSQFSWENIVGTAATDVVNQLRLEEIYLGVSEPLVRYVLGSEARDSDAIKDPQAAARRFMDLIYESTPNIERLSGVLMELYRAAGTGSTPSSANRSTTPLA